MHQVLYLFYKKDPPLGRWPKIRVWYFGKLRPELCFGRLWHRSSQGLWSHHRYQKEQTRQVLNSSLERKNETTVNTGRLLSSCCGTCTDVSLVKRHVGGEARPVNAVCAYIYAKYICDSLHGHTVKSVLQQTWRATVNTSWREMYLCAKASAFWAGPGRESELGVVSQISSVPLMFSIGGVTGVKGDASSPPGDSCMCTKDADKDR